MGVVLYRAVQAFKNYTKKFNKKRSDCEQILIKLQTINFDFKHNFKAELLTTHKSFYYIEFIPIDKIDFEYLEKDFVGLIDDILKSDIHKILKVQKKTSHW